MEIVKQISGINDMDSVNASIRDLPKPYVCVDAIHHPNGKFSIQRCTGETFIKQLNAKDALIILKLLNNGSISMQDFNYLSMIIAGINNAYKIILASNTVGRDNLGFIVDGASEQRDKKGMAISPMFIASPQKPLRDGDYVYSHCLQCTSSHDFKNIVKLANGGTSIVLDWPNNNQLRISRYMEEVSDTSDTLIITPNPKCLRRVLGEGIKDERN